jgi:hypothetical protein
LSVFVGKGRSGADDDEDADEEGFSDEEEGEDDTDDEGDNDEGDDVGDDADPALFLGRDERVDEDEEDPGRDAEDDTILEDIEDEVETLLRSKNIFLPELSDSDLKLARSGFRKVCCSFMCANLRSLFG